MVNWLIRLKKQLLEANGGATEAELQKELKRKDKLLDAYLDNILSKEEYQKKAIALDDRVVGSVGLAVEVKLSLILLLDAGHDGGEG